MSGAVEAVLTVESVTPRVVARLASLDFEIEYMRDDVEGVYSDADLEEAYRLVMSNQLTGDDFRQIIGNRRYNAQTLFFEDVVVFIFPAERYEAVFASFDYADDFPVMDIISRVAETMPGD